MSGYHSGMPMGEADDSGGTDSGKIRISRAGFGIALSGLGISSLFASVVMSFAWSWGLSGVLGELASFWRELDVVPLSILRVVCLLVGTFLVINPVASAERATREQVNQDSSTFGTVHFHDAMSGHVEINYLDNFNPAQLVLARQLETSSAGLRHQEAILREIYTQGLAQARLSFNVSMFFRGDWWNTPIYRGGASRLQGLDGWSAIRIHRYSPLRDGSFFDFRPVFCAS